jgi:hypothetical protein
MKKSILSLCSFTILLGLNVKAQIKPISINKVETERIEKYLSSDELEGRKTFSKGIEKAAVFIANEFEQAGIAKFTGNPTYLQTFSLIKPKFVSLSCKMEGAEIDPKKVVVITIAPNLMVKPATILFNKVTIKGAKQAVQMFGPAQRGVGDHGTGPTAGP